MNTKPRLLGFLCLSILFSCNTEQLRDDSIEQDYFKVTEYTVTETNSNRESQAIEYCFNVDLIAGQHIYIGSLGVTKSETDLILTYATIPNWTIDVTHVSIGDCNEQWVPTTRSGNPKIGKFDYSSTHSDGINEVSYIISREATVEDFCFAAHAVVYNINGEEETAWAAGLDEDGNPLTFSGNSWATYAQASLNDCEAGLINEIE